MNARINSRPKSKKEKRLNCHRCHWQRDHAQQRMRTRMLPRSRCTVHSAQVPFGTSSLVETDENHSLWPANQTRNKIFIEISNEKGRTRTRRRNEQSKRIKNEKKKKGKEKPLFWSCQWYFGRKSINDTPKFISKSNKTENYDDDEDTHAHMYMNNWTCRNWLECQAKRSRRASERVKNRLYYDRAMNERIRATCRSNGKSAFKWIEQRRIVDHGVSCAAHRAKQCKLIQLMARKRESPLFNSFFSFLLVARIYILQPRPHDFPLFGTTIAVQAERKQRKNHISAHREWRKKNSISSFKQAICAYEIITVVLRECVPDSNIPFENGWVSLQSLRPAKIHFTAFLLSSIVLRACARVLFLFFFFFRFAIGSIFNVIIIVGWSFECSLQF